MSKKEEDHFVHHPDDKLFGEVLRDPTNAKAYLQHFYPAISKQIDLETLTLESDSFLSSQFELFKADIIYRCRWKDSEESLYFSLIWEHKLQPETYVSIQIGLYIFLAMHKMVQEKGRPLEPILPLLFYNGKRNWQPKTIHQLFQKKAYFDFFKPFLPNFSFLFQNITLIPTEKILAIEIAFFRSALLAMANRNNRDLFIQHLNVIFDVEDDHQFNLIFIYFVAIMDSPPEELKQIVNKNLKTNQDKFMSSLEMLLKEGEEIGDKKREAYDSIVILLKIIEEFPKLSITKTVRITEVKKELVFALKKAIATKNKTIIQQIIKNQFLPNIELSKKEQAKINKLVYTLLKKT